MKPTEQVRANVTEDGLVLLDIEKGRIFTANGVAARIWQGIVVEKKSKAEVVDSIAREWNSAPEVVAGDVQEFVNKLKQQQLVIEV
jgi:hypothetical protein